MNPSKNQILSILGLGLIVGCFAGMLNLPQLIMLGIGFGILVGGIFKEIQASKNNEPSQQTNLTSKGKLILTIAVILTVTVQISLLVYFK